MSEGRDPTRGIAKQALKEHFTNRLGNPIKTPYYQSQLQVLYENDFFPWIISDALKELVSEGFLTILDQRLVPELSKLKHVKRIKFFANSRAITNSKDLERIKVRVVNISKLVDKYSDPKNSEIIGKHLESLVKAELRAQEFEIVGIHTNEYNGLRWTNTEHNLDFIAKHKTGRLVIGVEVKNTLDLMDPKEIDIKINICEQLGIIPVFAVRWLKPYLDCIYRQGGFCWIFKTQMHPLGNEPFTEELFNKLSALDKKNSKSYPLQFPVIVRTELPPKSINRFVNWVTMHKDNPPTVNTSYRCRNPPDEIIADIPEFF